MLTSIPAEEFHVLPPRRRYQVAKVSLNRLRNSFTPKRSSYSGCSYFDISVFLTHERTIELCLCCMGCISVAICSVGTEL